MNLPVWVKIYNLGPSQTDVLMLLEAMSPSTRRDNPFMSREGEWLENAMDAVEREIEERRG